MTAHPNSPGASASTGVALALLANFLFTSSDAIVKTLTMRYSVFQVIFMQVTFACIPLSIMLLRDGTLTRLKVRNPFLVFLRGLFAGVGTVCGFYAFSVLPLADVYSITFCAPMVVTLASIPLLGEKVGKYRFSAVIIGFMGILIMVQPGVAPISLGHAAAFGNVFTSAGVVLIMRRIAHEEERGVMVAAVMLGLLTVSIPAVALVGRAPDASDVGLAALAGLIMGIAQFLALAAIRRAPAASVAPMQYTMLVWALLYGIMLFNDPLRPNVVVGAVIVIASSLYIMHRERIRARIIDCGLAETSMNVSSPPDNAVAPTSPEEKRPVSTRHV
ncbi:DMT family transporter [Microvirga sp. KLBC 81]|uniref:DMT family transporter n=1 Tax=Microvirga sp. KLBC 81 TaxID=1862707 RepID=UPI00140322D1|nr:DMT family transporter [Microvirga sp. KLBC 81]